MKTKEIKVNNGRSIVLQSKENGIEVMTLDKDTIEHSYIIFDAELVMLLNYYRNCKSGIEKSSYIKKGKIVNTNVVDVNGKFIEFIE